MKKIFWILLFTLSVGAAYAWGTLSAQWKNEAWHQAQESRQKEFAHRLDRYTPTCSQLQQEGFSPVVTTGEDRIMVHTAGDYFYVIGINIAPGKAPLTSWWGAGRTHALQNCPKS